MNTISFMTANFVARQVGYKMHGWGHGDKATNEYFRPEETFAARFDEILRDVRAMGFQAIDLWTSHLGPAWATTEQVATARDLLARYGFPVVSLAGWFGSSPEEFEACCRLAVTLDVPVLGGSTSVLDKDREFVIDALRRHGLRLAIENHPEKSPAEMIAKIGDGGGGTLGTAVDTGWYGTQGYDAARAIEELGPYVMHVHLKDVLAAGEHDTCRFGRGVVPIEGCVRALQRIGYRGAISVEHEPEQFDPTADCVAGLSMLRRWLAE